MVLVTPVTSDRAQAWAAASPRLYPKLPAEAGGLPTNSIALLDQTRAWDARRLDAYLGTLTVAQFRPIREGLLRMLGFRLTSTGRR
jgi:mRNA interferase MazF